MPRQTDPMHSQEKCNVLSLARFSTTTPCLACAYTPQCTRTSTRTHTHTHLLHSACLDVANAGCEEVGVLKSRKSSFFGSISQTMETNVNYAGNTHTFRQLF